MGGWYNEESFSDYTVLYDESNKKECSGYGSHWRKYTEHLFTFCQLDWKDENKGKEAGNGTFVKEVINQTQYAVSLSLM